MKNSQLMEARQSVCNLSQLISQGSHKPGKPGIVREFCKTGKVREKSGNFTLGQGIFCSSDVFHAHEPKIPIFTHCGVMHA